MSYVHVLCCKVRCMQCPAPSKQLSPRFVEWLTSGCHLQCQCQGDLFRDLEEDFEQNKKSGGDDTRSSSNFWKHLGEDLLEFLEQNEMPRREDVDNLKPKASQPNPKPKPSRGRAGEKAQAPAFDSIDKELEDLKRKMKRDS
mmetsp:Transcript_6006/g.15289  ORF Transcript_6006/g.15289 Transcript_6006/m.15289 type:complete len:142 (+) Transcript_6006:903-1328(+)